MEFSLHRAGRGRGKNHSYLNSNPIRLIYYHFVSIGIISSYLSIYLVESGTLRLLLARLTIWPVLGAVYLRNSHTLAQQILYWLVYSRNVIYSYYYKTFQIHYLQKIFDFQI